MNSISNKWLIPLIHIVLIILVYTSPWFLPWPYIVLIFLLYHLQLSIFKGCILSQAQFKDKQGRFYFYYLKKVFPKLKSSTIDLAMDYIMPFLIIILAYIIQTT